MHARWLKKDYDTFDDIFIELCDKKLCSILDDKTHPLSIFIKRSPKSGRILHVTATKARYFNSFLPSAIRHFVNPRGTVPDDS